MLIFAALLLASASPTCEEEFNLYEAQLAKDVAKAAFTTAANTAAARRADARYSAAMERLVEVERAVAACTSTQRDAERREREQNQRLEAIAAAAVAEEEEEAEVVGTPSTLLLLISLRRCNLEQRIEPFKALEKAAFLEIAEEREKAKIAGVLNVGRLALLQEQIHAARERVKAIRGNQKSEIALLAGMKKKPAACTSKDVRRLLACEEGLVADQVCDEPQIRAIQRLGASVEPLPIE